MKKGFKHIKQEAKAPSSIKEDVMWHIERVFFLEAIIKHFTVKFGNTFVKLFGGNSSNKKN
ncbi:MAG: hypothetical protein CSA39_01605 [Flavobacteriales bacterium]|nr:MAG: hypothetical protein CSA39_01605 [Flavobacteriales bacterium]